MKIWHWLIIIGCFLIATPILLNYLLPIVLPCNPPIIGEVTDWLSFWGSYSGGVLTALIGFITIYTSSRHTYLTIKIEQQRVYIQELGHQIFLINKDLTFADILSISLIASGNTIQIDDLKREQLRINELSMRVINNANMWGALHDDDRDRDMNLFCQEYKKGMKYYSSLCKEMTLFLDNELKEYNKPNINKQLLDKQFRERLNEIIQEHISRVGNFDKVFYQSGKSLLLNERKKLDALLKQQL